MSSQDEAAASRPAETRAVELGAFQSPISLAARDGGGVVFPSGFLGPAFYLPEWEFIRFCSRIHPYEPESNPRSWWHRLAVRPSRFQQIVIAVVTMAVLVGLGRLGVLDRGDFVFGLALYLLCGFYLGLWTGVVARPRKVAELYPTAVRLPFYAHWWQHITIVMVTAGKSLFRNPLWMLLLHAFFAYILYRGYGDGLLHPLLAAGTLPVFAVRIGYQLVILVSLVVVRLRLGRMPTAEDVQPL
ncbi:hypothetical protein [Pelagibius sp.]|uniref:hypothetical protein n=1 Tax=Pelagibius sp. TaxID=1931238 RepID=UPI002639B8AD|nr:hypothetical protein [Pelagibius sp.]